MEIHVLPGMRSSLALLTESVEVVGESPSHSRVSDDDLTAAFLRALARTEVDAPADKLASLAFGLSYLSLILVGQLASSTGRSPEEQVQELALQLAERVDDDR